MKKSLVWFFAFIITIGAAYYQRKTGPTYPFHVAITLNDMQYDLKLVRSIGLDERSEIRLNINDTTVKANLYYKRYRTEEVYQRVEFYYREYPVRSLIMNSVFNIYKESGLYADIPQQPPAGKIQYYIEITDNNDNHVIMQDSPVVVRYKGSVPGLILIPHILIMFVAMLFSTSAGLMSILKIPEYRRTGIWTLVLLAAGGMILGPLVQKYAFGELWTGIPFGWDLTDNKTLIAFLFWILAVLMNLKKEKPVYTLIAAAVLLIIYSIPHSLFGSELDYSSGKVIQGVIVSFFLINQKIS